MEKSNLDNAHSKQQSPRHLFEELQRQEQQLSEAGFNRVSTEAAKFRFFNLYPFTPERARTEEARGWLGNDAHKYQLLMILLRKCRTNDARMFVLANLFYQEGICQPEEFLGKQFSKYARAAFRGPRGRLSLTSVRQAFIVEMWVPYFERLLKDQRSGQDLHSLGYEQGAIQACRGKKNPVAATCKWLSPQFSLTPLALANAHSAVYSDIKRSHPELFQRKV